MAEPVIDTRSANVLADLRADYSREPRLGCSLVAHRDLGFCASCIRTPDPYTKPVDVELTGWHLLAMAQRGVPHQPFENAHYPTTEEQT